MNVEGNTPDPLSPPPPEEAPETAPEPAPAPRRRGARTIGLIAVAAVLGLVGGTAVGYGIQAEREPTPLPALNQLDLAYPAKPLPKGQEPKPLSAAEDRGVRMDGDLRKLLLPKPAGARAAEFRAADGWMRVASYAGGFKDEGYMLEFLNESRVRRVAERSWQTGEHRETVIHLVQFSPSDTLGAADHAEGQMDYMPEDDHAGNAGDPVKGSGNGRYYLYPVEKKAGYLDFYEARAILHRGDVMVDIHVFDTEKISKKDIRTLAERQLERL
ncbi:hypothetical protein [Streptomyces sp. NPDC008121]|uniref:hypothetical protein n=1 Tax=Streptomyces sp. NPDC008121 TaxID=3364809 RepID=UPI0036EE7D9A